jgi:anoctamin-10
VTEWLHGVRLAAPDEQTRAAMDQETITDAERLRVVYLLITSSERDGGAGVTPGLDGWTYVESIFPLHDTKFNRVYFQYVRSNVGMDSELVSKMGCQRP